MLIKATHSVVYDTDNQEFMKEFLEYQDDHTPTLFALQAFIVDRFINPNFDGGNTKIEIMPTTTCRRCGTFVRFDEVSDGYYAYCPQHDEDLYKGECN